MDDVEVALHAAEDEPVRSAVELIRDVACLAETIVRITLLKILAHFLHETELVLVSWIRYVGLHGAAFLANSIPAIIFVAPVDESGVLDPSTHATTHAIGTILKDQRVLWMEEVFIYFL